MAEVLKDKFYTDMFQDLIDSGVDKQEALTKVLEIFLEVESRQ